MINDMIAWLEDASESVKDEIGRLQSSGRFDLCEAWRNQLIAYNIALITARRIKEGTYG